MFHQSFELLFFACHCLASLLQRLFSCTCDGSVRLVFVLSTVMFGVQAMESAVTVGLQAVVAIRFERGMSPQLRPVELDRGPDARGCPRLT